MRSYPYGKAAGLAGAEIETCPHRDDTAAARDWRAGWHSGMRERARARGETLAGPDEFDRILTAALARGERPDWGLQ